MGLWFFVSLFVLYFSYLLWFECVTPNSVLVIWHPVFRGGTFRKCFDHEGSGISGLAELGHWVLCSLQALSCHMIPTSVFWCSRKALPRCRADFWAFQWTVNVDSLFCYGNQNRVRQHPKLRQTQEHRCGIFKGESPQLDHFCSSKKQSHVTKF